jgi:hypothetical protein
MLVTEASWAEQSDPLAQQKMILAKQAEIFGNAGSPQPGPTAEPRSS